jgi:hypothetical protein
MQQWLVESAQPVCSGFGLQHFERGQIEMAEPSFTVTIYLLFHPVSLSLSFIASS